MPRFNSREEYEEWKAGLAQRRRSPDGWSDENDTKPVDEPSWQSLSDGYGRADGERPIRQRKAYSDQEDAYESEQLLRSQNRKEGIVGVVVGSLILGIAAGSFFVNWHAGFIYPWPLMVGWTGLPSLVNGLGLLITGSDPDNRGLGLSGKFSNPWFLAAVLAYLIGDAIFVTASR